MRKWQNPEIRQAVLKQARELCATEDASLLYLVFFGSALYGTDTANSDLDVRGIFAPDLDRVLLGVASRSLRLSTGDAGTRNSAADIDIDLWSARYWICDLLKAGDTGAIDLLFSASNEACVLYAHPLMTEIFTNADRLINPSAVESAASYALRQAKKYGIKGSRLGLLRRLREAMAEILAARGQDMRGQKLCHILPELNQRFAGDAFYAAGSNLEGEYVVIGGKMHMAGIPLEEFAARIKNDLQRYGNRAEDALAGNGVDFKALSHALRASGQQLELLRTGRISYPLAFREQLMLVKSGALPYPVAEKMILDDIEKMRAQVQSTDGNPHHLHWDGHFADEAALRLSWARDKQANQGNVAVNQLVQDFLSGIEQNYQVRILLAVESGSRAWNMASHDSDFDVRFVYAHSRDWYLESCVKKRDDSMRFAPKATPHGDIDAEGWDLTKALELLGKSNPSILEWAASPVVYRENKKFAQLIRHYAPEAFNAVSVFYHYQQMAKKCWKEYQQNRKLKNICYAARGALASLIVLHEDVLPPIDILKTLNMARPYLPDQDFANELCKVIERKRAGEKLTGDVPEAFADCLEQLLQLDFTSKAGKKANLSLPTLFLECLKIADAGACSGG